MALNNGFTATIVMALGGWKTEWMMRRYAAVTDETLRAAAEAVSGSAIRGRDIRSGPDAAAANPFGLSRLHPGMSSSVEYAGQAPTAEMAVAPPSIRKSAPTTYAESSDAR